MFIIFFSIFALSVPIARIIGVEAPVSPMPDGSVGDKIRFGLFIMHKCFSNQCTLIGCLVIRQRVFYEIFHNYTYNPSFWIGVPFFAFICFCIAIPFVACSYTLTCTPEVSYSVFYCAMVIMALIFAYFLYYTYEASRVFVQFWANMRAFILHNVTQFIFFSILVTDTANVPVLEGLTSTYIVWLLLLDTFCLPLLKAFARKYLNKNLFEGIDVVGANYRALSDLEKLEQHIENKDLHVELENYSNSVLAGENVRFLRQLYELQQLETELTKDEIKKKLQGFMDQFFWDSKSDDQLNISDKSHRNAVKDFEENSWENISELMKAVQLEVRRNTILGIWPNYKESKAYDKVVSCHITKLDENSMGVLTSLHATGMYTHKSALPEQSEYNLTVHTESEEDNLIS
eukprot:Awhi_evm1s6940